MDNETILIVDDDQTCLALLERNLAALGFKIEKAIDGLEALALLSQKEFSRVLSDIEMPNMNGLELLKYIHEHHPDTEVILMTGFRDKYTSEQVIEAGATDLIEKPFSLATLREKLSRAA